MFKLRGKVTEVKEPVDIKNGEFCKREFKVEETEEKYPQSAMFEVFKKGEYIKYAKEAFPAKQGDVIEVEFSLRLNEFDYKKPDGQVKRIQNNVISAFKINVLEKAESQPDSQNPIDDGGDDLPF